MSINLFPHQLSAVKQLKTGSILCGGVGSGKTLTALAYYLFARGEKIKDLFVITTAAKRDTGDWKEEALVLGIKEIVIDSWNNIKKYINIKGSFFIFDEQRVVGSGVWVRSFLKITKENSWILLSATPGDTWMDYVPVFIANGFYKNRTEFIRRHVVYNTFTKYPKIDRYVDTDRLNRLKESITVTMDYKKPTTSHHINVFVEFDKNLFDSVYLDRWNPFLNKPIKDVGEFCHIMRKVVNSDHSRIQAVLGLAIKHKKIIVFYNFNYELEMLKTLKDFGQFEIAEYNGHKHEQVPTSEKWIYLVQYISGSEGWNCVETNTIVFYSQNYSYRAMTQAAGRIDRLNTPYSNLYYYTILSKSIIDKAISEALSKKKDFNIKVFS